MVKKEQKRRQKYTKEFKLEALSGAILRVDEAPGKPLPKPPYSWQYHSVNL
jgi:hypothetical protein